MYLMTTVYGGDADKEKGGGGLAETDRERDREREREEYLVCLLRHGCSPTR